MKNPVSPEALPGTIEESMRRLVATAVNGAEYVRFGGLKTEDDPAPFDVVAEHRVGRLRHYFPDAPPGRPAVLLIPPLMQVAEVWDISPATSVVRTLHALGVDPWVVDFGDPEREPGGGDRDLADHVLTVSEAIDSVREAASTDVHLLGYSQGGLFCYLTAAYRRCEGVASVITLGTPIEAIPLDKYVPSRVLWQATDANMRVLRHTGLPRWAVTKGFNWAQPQRRIKSKIDYLLALHDRDALLPREPQRKFLENGAWIGWAGPAMADAIDALKNNRFMSGGLVYGDRTVGMADVTCPVLCVVGSADFFAPIEQTRKIVHAAPYADVHEIVLPVGHFGLPVSSHARKKTWPGVAAWVRWIADGSDLPDYISALDKDCVSIEQSAPGERGIAANLTYGLGLVVGAGLSVPGTLAGAAGRAAESARELTVEAIEQIPQLVRLERMRPGTRISFGKLLADLAQRNPDAVCFLFEGRAHTRAAAGQRIDNVVRGLISLGVHKGERVGVLMDARPSALVAVAALNRLGAVAVMLRPGADLAREAQLGLITSVIVDPEHATEALALGRPVRVLGAGTSRTLPDGVVDMEQIDPATVELPSWYRPNAGRARDLAFIMFTADGERTRADHITNGRWALSALAAASATQLTDADTVYSVSPLHHASGLLLATAAAAAGGSRIAMANGFEPETFWTEIRRYGATVVPYTWTMLHDLVTADPRPEEQHHPIRLFVGSGMPPNLWRRVAERFAPASVLELYASTRTDAMLGNVSGRKIGAAGKPLPGSAKVHIARYDIAARRLVTGCDGFAVPAAAGETGMLLVAAEPGSHEHEATVLRGVFAADDAWIVTGGLFRYDADGDLWFVDLAAALIDTGRGLVSPKTVEDALGSLDAVDLAACYPVITRGRTKAVAAVTLRPGRHLDTDAVTGALQDVDPADRPDVVHVVAAVPVNSWYRPSVTALEAAGMPSADGHRAVWMLNAGSGGYREATVSIPHSAT